jgi:translation initiation factor 2B subunit (eIF-2B alpha/beta/delta family)
MATEVVSCFLRHRGRVLFGRRSDAVGTYSGRWGAVSGYAEGDPDDAAREEIEEEVGLLEAVALVRSGDPVEVVDGERTWVVHPYLFDCASDAATPNREFETVEWAHPTEIRRRETVPALLEAYDAVAPTVETVSEDREHGSAYVSLRALEVLRDAAGRAAEEGGDWEGLAALARELLDARPSMAALANRVNRSMYTADGRTPSALERAARRGIDRAADADDRAAERAADTIGESDGVLTLSRSGTVETALREGDPDRVVVLESRPDREGVGVAERLAEAGLTVTLTLDAAAAHVACEVDRVLVGADTVLADGSVVNKVGTRTTAVAAAREGVSMYAVAAADKISPGTEPRLESISETAIYGGDAPVAVDCPLFDRTPADLVAGLVTESGALDREGIAERAAEHERLARWDENGGETPGK